MAVAGQKIASVTHSPQVWDGCNEFVRSKPNKRKNEHKKQTKNQPFFSVSLPQIATKFHKIERKNIGWGLPPFQPTPPPFPTAALKRNAECTSRKKTGVDTHTKKENKIPKSRQKNR